MDRGPFRPQRSPGAPRPFGAFPPPGSGWGFIGARSPHGGSVHRGASPRGCGRESWGGSPLRFESGPRCFPGNTRSGGSDFRRPRSFSPGSAQRVQSSDASVEKYFSPSMVQDPWRHLQPRTTSEATQNRHAT